MIPRTDRLAEVFPTIRGDLESTDIENKNEDKGRLLGKTTKEKITHDN